MLGQDLVLGQAAVLGQEFTSDAPHLRVGVLANWPTSGMMGSQLGTMSRPPVHHCVSPASLFASLLGLLGCLALTGCRQPAALPRVLFVSVGTNADQKIDANGLSELKADMAFLANGFRRIDPKTVFQLSLYSDDDLLPVMQQRNRAALGPDLFLINGDTSRMLLKAGLVQAFPTTREELNRFTPATVHRLRTAQGQLAGLPAYLQTQLACFNSRRLSTPPGTLNQLLAVSAAGHQVGLSLRAGDVFWTAGSQGAIPGLEQAIRRQQPTAAQLKTIEGWLAWLQDASNQHRVTFYADQAMAEQQFARGQLDWLPCRSTSLVRLRRKMGAALGVTPLPRGDGGEASPINRLRVWALGSNSDALARERAIRFARFSTNPLIQRELTVSTQAVLPTNRFVEVPELSSTVLAAMVRASVQGEQAARLISLLEINDPRVASAQYMITELVFGQLTPKAATRLLINDLINKP